ncbi:hypothetical protein [Euzebya tangerina]|uniref:hypothetical protein n=1 Tax=Euzebya tangerina TaxID=591198 RepID=UPI0013C369BF|nr:hypothetical protein [Euzebya tangerina]
MQQLSTTVVAVVGSQAQPAVQDVAGANLRVIAATDDPVTTWAEVRRSRSPFTVITDDPLSEVAQAWSELFASQRSTGRLEVAVREARQRIRAGVLDLPDYYLTAGEAPFHLTVLAPQSAVRVVPLDADVARTVSGLSSGRWWPPPGELLADLDRRLPDRFAAANARDEPSLVALGAATHQT